MNLRPALNVAVSVIVIACLAATQAMPPALAQAPGSNSTSISNDKDGAAASGALVASAATAPAPQAAAPQAAKKSRKKWFILAAVAATAGVLAVVLTRDGTEPTITIGPPTVGP